jgi:hypothetical protein
VPIVLLLFVRLWQQVFRGLPSSYTDHQGLGSQKYKHRMWLMPNMSPIDRCDYGLGIYRRCSRNHRRDGCLDCGGSCDCRDAVRNGQRGTVAEI